MTYNRNPTNFYPRRTKSTESDSALVNINHVHIETLFLVLPVFVFFLISHALIYVAMDYVVWQSCLTAAYYMQLSKVMLFTSPSSIISGQTENIEGRGILYDNCNNVRHFAPAFPLHFWRM